MMLRGGAGAVTPLPIEREYERHKNISPEDISKLRHWLSTQPHLPAQHITDQDLVLVYHSCELSSEVSKQVLDLHFTLRTIFTAFFKDRCVDDRLMNCLETVLFSPCPVPTVEGYRAIYCRLLDTDPRRFVLADVVRTFMMVFDLWQLAEGTWPGFILIIDMDTSKMGHILKVEPMTVRQMLYFLQEAMLVRLKGVHFLNAPVFMDKLMMLLKPFLKKSILEILHVHEVGSQTIYEYVPRAAFPREEGGENKDHNTIRDETIALLKANSEYFCKENQHRVDEARRPGGGGATVEELFGIQGSFKKLDID